VGIAIKEGHIGSVDDPITSYIPELEGQEMDEVTIRHLLNMPSGLKYSGESGGGEPLGDDAKTYYDPKIVPGAQQPIHGNDLRSMMKSSRWPSAFLLDPDSLAIQIAIRSRWIALRLNASCRQLSP
jgi:CubicO group peptidase (beta-lactamase class C family)